MSSDTFSFRRILVASGGSPHSQVAVARAAALARQNGAGLHLVGILPQVGTPLMNAAVAFAGAETFEAQVMSAESEQLDGYLERTAQALREGGLTVSWEVLRAMNPAEAILQAARQIDADLIVLGRRHTSAWTAALSGSVSDRVSHASPVDVLVAR